MGSRNGDHAVPINSVEEVSQSEVTLRNKAFPKPNGYCALIVRHPKKAMAFTFLGHMMMLLITAVLVRVGYNIIPIEFAQLPLQIQWDEDFLHGMAWTTRNDDSNNIINRGVLGNGSQEERSARTDLIQLFYEEPGGNVFTKTNLKDIKKIEDEIFNNVEFQKFCMLFNKSCVPPMSILRYFDGTYSKISAVFNDPDFDNIPTVLYTANNNIYLKKQLQMFLGKDHTLTDAVVSSPITRTFMYTAGPLSGYANVTDREEAQDKLLEDMMKLELLPICDKYFKSGIGTMNFFYNSGKLFGTMLSKQAMMDMMLAAASLCFIFIFMLIQTQSLWITCFSLLSILTCFCCANLIYRIVFDFIYFGMFHILAVFIILGIGADDIFVFLDTWKNSAHNSYPSLEHRLSDVYGKAGAAMLFTSLTTAIAFMVSGLSPLLAVNSFGIFSSILVIVNYLSVIIYLPTVVINYHLSWEKWTWPCCRPCKREPTSVSVTGSPRSASRKNPVVRFFAGPYYRFITHKIAKWIVMVMCLGTVACFAYFAAQLVPQEEQIKFLKDDSNFGKALDRSSNAFAPSNQDRNVKIYLIWGLKKQDRSACHKTDYQCKGKNVWDESFDLNQPPAQKALLDLCDKLKNGLTSEQKEKLHINEDVVTKALEVDCFIENLNEFLTLEQQNTAKYPVSTVLTLPMSQSKGTTIMQYNSAHYNMTAVSPYFYRYFEEALDYWLYSGYTPQYNRMPHFASYNKMLGSSLEDGLSLPVKTNKDIMYGTRLRYAAIVVNTSLVSTTLGYPTGLPVRDSWEEFMDAEFAKMPASLQGGFMATPTGFNTWHWLKIQKTLADSAVLGIVIGICIAYPILIIATGNLLVALYASVTIICITVSVVGVIPMAGWKLGLLESLNLVLVVGLAVDYVVHLAEGYSRSAAKDRLGRVHSMLEEVGISVLSGACTTLGASVFMFFAEILFFTQFGIFMFSTIGFSILYALFLFTSVLAIMGPQGEFASIRPWFVALKNKVIGRKKEAEDCDKCIGKGFLNPEEGN